MRHIVRFFILVIITSLPLTAERIHSPFGSSAMSPIIVTDTAIVDTISTNIHVKKPDKLFSSDSSTINSIEIHKFRNALITGSSVQAEEGYKAMAGVNKYPPEISNNQDTNNNCDGLAYLLVGNTLLGTFYFGPELSAILEPAGGRPEHIHIFAAAAGFLVPYSLTRNTGVSMASAHMSVFGGVAGIYHGYLISELLRIEDTHLRNGVSLLASIAENIGLFSLAAGTGISAGKADVMAYYSILGVMHGYGWNCVFGVEEHDKYFAAAPLIGSLGGYIAGNFIANTQNYTSGDATMAFLQPVLYACFTNSLIFALCGDCSGEVYSIATILSTGLGAYIGNEMVKGLDFSASSSCYAILGTIGGAVGGLVVGAYELIEEGNEEIDIARLLPLASSIGALVGYMAIFEAFKTEGNDDNSQTGLSLVVSPAGLAEGLSGNQFLAVNYKTFQPVSAPVISIRYSF